MNKSDLKDGMVVTLKYGNECVIAGSFLINNNLTVYNDLINYNEDLINKYNGQYNIVRVQKENKFETLWERKVIDWSKVPAGTKVLVKDHAKEEWRNGIFIDESEEGKFITYDRHNSIQEYWNYCKLAEEPQEEVTEDEIYEKYDKYVYFGECKENGLLKSVGEFILDNYNVTRKEK